MNWTARILAAAAAAVVLASPVLAQEQDSRDGASQAAEQARIESARQNTKMKYVGASGAVSRSVVDPYTQARNDRNGGALSVTRPDGR